MASIMSTSSRNDSVLLEDCSPLSQACIKALTDRLDEKRKLAASEIEKMTCDFSLSNNLVMVNRLIIVLGKKFCLSTSPNARKGGLLGLAAVMVGFKNGSMIEPPEDIVEDVIRPILTCFLDSDSRVRYYACEALYNVTKVAEANILPLFKEIFDNMSKIVADPDTGVRSGAEVLDRLLKDIVVEQQTFDGKSFVPKLEDYIYTRNPFTRLFIISWIRLLDSKLDMIYYLPQLLDGIFNCLYDSTEEIRASTLSLLSEFLNKIVVCPTDRVNIPSLIKTLLKHAQNDKEDVVQYTAIAWIRQFIGLMDNQDLINFTPGILIAILPCLAIQLNHEGTGSSSISSRDRHLHHPHHHHHHHHHHHPNSQRFIPQSPSRGNICEISSLVNSSLLEQITIVLNERKNTLGVESNLMTKPSISYDLEPILKVLVKKLEKQDHPIITLAVLDWLRRLKKADSDLILSSSLQKKLFQSLLDTLSARSDAVVKNTLRVITDLFCFDQNYSSIANTSDEQDNQQVTGGVTGSGLIDISGASGIISSSGGGGGGAGGAVTTSSTPATKQSATSNDDNSLLKTTKDSDTSELDKRKSPIRTTMSKTTSSKKVAIAPATSGPTASIQSSAGDDTTQQSNANVINFIQALCKMFRDKESVFEERGTFIVINLCSMVRPDVIYKSFAEILKDERADLKFAYNMVQKLNQILLTTQPLYGLRSRLSSANINISNNSDEDQELTSLFLSLYYAWCHSPIAVLTLCLLTNHYKNANEIVVALSQTDITIEVLTQIDWVVQLIESPVFACLRMKLLDVTCNQYLLQSLYGLLMILPQSDAYNKLGHRLDQVYKFMNAQPHFKSTINITQPPTSLSSKDLKKLSSHYEKTSVESLMKHYFTIQNQAMKPLCSTGE